MWTLEYFIFQLLMMHMQHSVAKMTQWHEDQREMICFLQEAF